MRKTNYRIYWEEAGKLFKDDFTDMSKFIEAAANLRTRQAQEKTVKHIATSIDHEDLVGEQGVAAPSADYAWTKRRGYDRKYIPPNPA